MPQGRQIPVPSARETERQQQQPRRRGSGKDGRGSEQPPWRSSLDLVWSYSRSQAFYGDNISTSPSFVEHHWARRRLEGERAGDEHAYEDSSNFDSQDDDEEDEDWHEEERDNISESVADEEEEVNGDHNREYNDASGSSATAWPGEQLPPNSVQRSSLQQKRRLSANKAHALEEDDNQRRERRGRSRSRSPKRLASSTSQDGRGSFGSTCPGSGGPLLCGFKGERGWQAQAPLQENGLPVGRLSQSNQAGGPNERTPLLKAADSPAAAATGTASGSASGGGALLQRQRSLRKDVAAQYGTSTFLQSWFNTLNALIGVGILALPLAFSYAGWIFGPLLFLLAGALTNYTGKILARIMARQPSLRTYADIGSYAFGPRARLAVSALFCLELWAVCVALIILFADSAQAILPPTLPVNAYKAIGLAFILPTIFLPLNLLSPISVIGIVSTFTLFAVVLSDGLIKQEAPGSLWRPGPMTLWPQWDRLPLAFGLIMSGFSSHPVIPSLVKDMQDPDPRTFGRMLDLAYIAATFVYVGMGAVGYAMFGTHVSDEITRDLARTPGFPATLNRIAIWLIVINPLAKFALAARPINATVEVLFGVEASQVCTQMQSCRKSSARRKSASSGRRRSSNGYASGGVDVNTGSGAISSSTSGASLANGIGNTGNDANPLSGSRISLRAAEMTSEWSPCVKSSLRIGIRVSIACLITVTAIVLPGFEKVMAFLGAFLAFATCVFGPLLAKLKLFHREMSWTRIGVDIFILFVSLVAAATGTAWAFLPGRKE
ncbi:hypothetical protein K437DRAFT_227989 [Tilletiaria anomala UBC 951]|uniref:Amino acid transporter transmembrane domain-containing protein n=1 Tax=Tilletiaria anomala (strain ATCC 24038 / CBS 436.72 / UBC 951) TaxID=1037660 RepID=A0A066VLL3_TILAU|nr:uncharacterized protein K437DRAFT_227989 [Tilletiaria anomala UBC 951]KDN39460.1 hypothetical protein K437DRAFT_227989 [Tilletiaria anomala UBC 951]